jgi:hypothetical protein
LSHWAQTGLEGLSKTIHVTDKALQHLADTLWKRARERETLDVNDPLLPTCNRAPEMALIIAGIYAWVEWHRNGKAIIDCVWITLDHMQRAVLYVQAGIETLERISPSIGADWFVKKLHRAIEILQQRGAEGIAHSDLLRMLKISKDEFGKILATLDERNEITRENSKQVTKPGTWYYWSTTPRLQLISGGLADRAKGPFAPEREDEEP